MRSFILPFALFSLNLSSAQTILCDTLPIFYDPVSITFTTGEISFGDSVIVVEMTNTSTTDMAYPQLKLVPLTPLPPGMSQNTHWDTFASSWNTGVTMPADCFFDVDQPIPVNYTVTFEAWARNLTPLLVDDSCVFDAPFTINLNPESTSIREAYDALTLQVWPNPAGDLLHVKFPTASVGATVVLSGPDGSIVRVLVGSPADERVLDVTGLDAGPYLLSVVSEDGCLFRQVVVAR